MQNVFQYHLHRLPFGIRHPVAVFFALSLFRSLVSLLFIPTNGSRFQLQTYRNSSAAMERIFTNAPFEKKNRTVVVTYYPVNEECRCYNRIDFNRCEQCQILLLRSETTSIEMYVHTSISNTSTFSISPLIPQRGENQAVIRRVSNSHFISIVYFGFIFLSLFWWSDVSSNRWHR